MPSGPVTPDTIATLADEHAPLLYALGLRFCGDPTEAEDLVQEVFLQAIKGWDSFEGKAARKTWLYTIAARTCQRMHRKRAAEPARIDSLDELLPFGEPRIAAVADDIPDALQHQIRAEAREHLEIEIAGLPDDFRVPLILKEIVGFTVPEIARILAAEEGTIRSRVHRARLKLRAALDAVIPRAQGTAPPPAYDRQTCMDLLSAKQEAIDQGVPFDNAVICDRCRSVFASLDLAHEVCQDLAKDALPPDVRERLYRALNQSTQLPAPPDRT